MTQVTANTLKTAARHLSRGRPARASRRSGATLLVTLGVLTVISVMIATFLLTARYQRRSAQHYRDKTVARQTLDIALARAMQFADSAMIASNFAQTAIQPLQPGKEGVRRVSPVNAWFRSDYQPELPDRITDKVDYQTTDVLLVPVMERQGETAFQTNALTVDLLTAEVRGLLPTAFTNRLGKTPTLRSGWIGLDNDTRVSFAVLNCSGFVDANTFLTGPTNQRPPLVCYSQPDVGAWLAAMSAQASPRFEPLAGFLNPDDSPFSPLSYDTDPDVYPLHYDCFEASPVLGRTVFCSYPTVNLNLAHAYEAMRALKEQATYCKFNLNSLTNHLAAGTVSTETLTPWFNSAPFRAEWLDPVVFLLNAMRNEELDADTPYRWPDSSAIAWNLANFMDADRIPNVSEFPTDNAPEPELATRANYAVEDVPLINKVSVFSIFDPDHPGQENPDAPKDPSYYFEGSTDNLSNHYAVAVELWYPFVPNMPPQDSACYVGIYTNAEDVLTTTNRPWTSRDLRDWFRWNDVNSSNTVMQTLFTQWGDLYLREVGQDITNNPLWQVVSYEEDLWFTPAMTNHPYWPAPETNGTISITGTPVWQAFFPDTFTAVTTNGSEVTTNVYTYYTTTNSSGETAYVPPLPMTAAQSNSLIALFAMLPTNSTAELYDALLMDWDEYEDWDNLMRYFNENPQVMNRTLPSRQAPTLGNMTPEDRHILWPENGEDKTVEEDWMNHPDKLEAPTFQGYFWTIYPKQAVSFREVVETKPPEGSTGLPSDYQATTNYYALGDTMSGKRNTVWVRPVVTVPVSDAEAPTDGSASAVDVIVDEALLTQQSEGGIPVRGWTSVTNLYIPDPRRNAYAQDWRGFPDGARWLDSDILNTTNLSTGVSELPFIHYDAPLASIGEIGHIYAGYRQRFQTEDNGEAQEALPVSKSYDTISFSTRSGAALLDIFTLSPTNGPRRGLVQANTPYAPVLKTLLADIRLGWTNNIDGTVITDGQLPLYQCGSAPDRWAEVYADANTNSPLNIGWRSFADMMPALSTNRLFQQGNVWEGSPELQPLHDYTEDVLRGLADKVSFRQNIFVVVVAAQTLSPASTEQSPVILSDQRAAVTVLRDAYSGRWMIYNWIWLTE